MPDASANTWEESLIADLRASGGRPSAGPLAGGDLLVLYTTGAKTGEKRRAILSYTRDGDDYIVAGTNNGRPTHPAWVGNIRTSPKVAFEVGDATKEATATIADSAERDRLWAHHVDVLPRFGDYPDQVGGRIIPVVRLTPVG
jgi:deazaflavin-dependent oxidoreductase (nitroreductase family)